MNASMSDEDRNIYKSKKHLVRWTQGKSHEISHKMHISGVSHCIIHAEWMLMVEWMGYITASWSSYSLIMRNVLALKNDRPTSN